MSENINPSKEPQPIPLVSRDVVHEIAAGMGIRRVPLFSAPQTESGWASQMLTHIAVAKRLGFTMFEIDVTPGRAKKETKEKEDQTTIGLSFNEMVRQMYSVVPGDEWKVKVPKAAEVVERVVDTFVITIYALVVE